MTRHSFKLGKTYPLRKSMRYPRARVHGCVSVVDSLFSRCHRGQRRSAVGKIAIDGVYEPPELRHRLTDDESVEGPEFGGQIVVNHAIAKIAKHYPPIVRGDQGVLLHPKQEIPKRLRRRCFIDAFPRFKKLQR